MDNRNISPSVMTVPIYQAEAGKTLAQEKKIRIPKDVVSISLEIEAHQEAWVTGMVYDENHVLRAQFMNIHTPQPIVIHRDKEKTSPYTIYGEIMEGSWTIDIVVLAKETVPSNQPWCTCIISFNDETNIIKADAAVWQASDKAVFHLTEYDTNQVVNPKTGWYKGDFHTHTIYSDGEMTREENMESAKKQQLDFFVATDHHIVPTSWFEKTDILVIPGVEVTAPYGHFNILSAATSPFSNQRMVDMLTEDGMNRIIQDDYGDALISINHPFLTEWKWLFEETPLDKIDCIEICNDPTYPANDYATEMALKAWDILLNDGYAVTGIGGSDSHLKPTDKYEGSQEPSLIGDPGTFVYCNYLSASEVIHGVKQGNVVISRGERIDFTMDNLIAGNQCEETEGVIQAQVDTDEVVYMEWILDGKIVKKEQCHTSTYSFYFSNSDAYHWIRVNVRYADGRFYGCTNPIYFGKKTPSMTKWGQLLRLMKEVHDD